LRAVFGGQTVGRARGWPSAAGRPLPTVARRSRRPDGRPGARL